MSGTSSRQAPTCLAALLPGSRKQAAQGMRGVGSSPRWILTRCSLKSTYRDCTEVCDLLQNAARLGDR